MQSIMYGYGVSNFRMFYDIILFEYMCEHMQDRGQPMLAGSLVPSCESKGLNSGRHQSWQQALYPLITSFRLSSLVPITSLILFYV